VFWLSKWRSIWSRRSILLLFCDSSKEPRLRKLLLNASLSRKSHRKSNWGEIGTKTTSSFENCDHQFRLSHEKVLSLFRQDASTSDVRHYVAPKNIHSSHLENVDHDFEWFMSNIFENWTQKLAIGIKPSRIASKKFEVCTNFKYEKCENTSTIIWLYKWKYVLQKKDGLMAEFFFELWKRHSNFLRNL